MKFLSRMTGRRQFLAAAGATGLAAIAACMPTASPTAAPPKPTEAPKPAAGGAAAPTAAAGSQPAAAAQAPAKAGETSLEYWINWAPNTPDGKFLTERLIPEYEKANPGTKIKYEYVATTGNTQAAEKLLTAINGGTPPDLNYFDRFIVTSWAAQGFLTELTDRAKTDKLSQEQFLKEAWLEATFKDKLFATPYSTDFRALYYNKKHFQEAGIANPPTTLAELDAAAEKLNKKQGDKFTRVGLIPWAYQGQLYTWGWLHGGEFYDPKTNQVTANDPKIVQALEWMVSYGKKYGVDQLDAFASAMKNQQGGFASNEQHGLVLDLISMASDGDWQIANHKVYMKPDQFEQFDVVPLPQAPGGPKTSSWGGGWSTVLPKGVKQADAAWKFARWNATDGQKLFVIERGRVPTLLEMFDKSKMPAGSDPRFLKFFDLKDVVRFRPNIPAGQMLWTELLTAQDNAIHGKGSAKELLDGVTQRVNAENAKFK
jgi:multiple sugar transport system substrate-binding protein